MHIIKHGFEVLVLYLLLLMTLKLVHFYFLVTSYMSLELVYLFLAVVPSFL